MNNKIFLLLNSLVFIACSSTTHQTQTSTSIPKQEPIAIDTQVVNKSSLPDSYKDIQFPEFKYTAPDPLAYRAEISENIIGYIIQDSSLPLSSLYVIFEESTNPKTKEEIASKELLSGMFRRGGSLKNSVQVIDDSLEFISASISGGVSARKSFFSVNTLSRNFEETALLAREIFTTPAFDSASLEIQKTAAITAYERRYDSPSAVLSALKTKVNYVNSPRLWDANLDEYKSVSQKELIKYGNGLFNPKKIIFAFSGNISRDSAIQFFKSYFADWKVKEKTVIDSAETIKLLRKPGIFAVERPVTQANISLNQPFLKRPHPDYYPAALASFILGGGGFSSRLTTRIRSDEGLAYSVYSSVGNSYFDTTLTTIALQTKAEQAPYAIRLIQEEIQKLATEGPTEQELLLAKKTLIESLPSLFATPEDIVVNFAEDEFTGKKTDHYLEYVREIEAVTAEQIKTMIAKYFDFTKMTISIVGPSDSWKGLENVVILPLDSLEIRP